VRRGPALTALRELVRETEARRVHWNRRYEPAAVQRDTNIKATLRAEGVAVHTFNASLLFEPWTIQTAASTPFQVFTPFWKACLRAAPPPPPRPAPSRWAIPSAWPAGEPIAALGLEPRIDWTAGMRSSWRPGERGARIELDRFLDEGLPDYAAGRDLPGRTGTSRLSPHLHFGEIAPAQIWHAVQARSELATPPGVVRGAECYLRELGWREFAHHLLFHFPHTPDSPLRPEFERFPWKEDPAALRAWQRGRTGFPIVDAGLRELWTTGWMHNRVRMLVASFLVKDLLLPWQLGARWFWDTLVDADLANNTLGWQWTAGCGADAAPFFRIFNPTLQGERFDADGAYVRRWVPELAKLPDAWIHKPWQAPAAILAQAGVELGTSYPRPMVDHQEARDTALAALQIIRRVE